MAMFQLRRAAAGPSATGDGHSAAAGQASTSSAATTTSNNQTPGVRPAAPASPGRPGDPDVIYVSAAQVKAAQLLVELAQRRKQSVDPAVAAIAGAQRVNGHPVTSTTLAGSTTIGRNRSADPSPA